VGRRAAPRFSHGEPHLGTGDLVHDFYPAGRQALHGYLHYQKPGNTPEKLDVFRYPPFAALLFAPFALFSLHTALFVWWAVSFCAVGATAVIIAQFFATERRLVSGVAFLGLMAFGPIGTSLHDKVDPWVMLLIATSAWLMLTSETKPQARQLALLAGLLMGVSVAVKLYPALAVILILAARPPRAREFAFGIVLALLLTTLAAIVVLGIGSFSAYLTAEATSSPALTGFPYAFGALNIAFRLLVANPYAPGVVHLPPDVISDAFALVVTVVVAASAWFLWRRSTTTQALAWVLGLVLMTACSPFLEEPHLAPLALIPVLLICDGRLAPKTVVMMVVAAVVCTVCGEVLPHHVGEALSLLIVATIAVLAAQQGMSAFIALAMGALLLLAAPSFMNVTLFWPAPLSALQVLVGGIDYVGVLAVLAGVLLAYVLLPRDAHPDREYLVHRVFGYFASNRLVLSIRGVLAGLWVSSQTPRSSSVDHDRVELLELGCNDGRRVRTEAVTRCRAEPLA
jgi:hypothetical protein